MDIKYNNHRPPTLVGAFYRPPSASIDFFDNFDNVLATASTENKECILLGDFNCNFYDNNTDNLKVYATLYGFDQMISSPTRVTNQSHTVIDLVFKK